MRFALFIGIALSTLNANAQAPVRTLWNDLKAKRDALPMAHQEFEVTTTVKTPVATESEKVRVTLDTSHEKWRERLVNAEGDRLTIYDGTDEFYMGDGGDEFVRVKSKPNDGAPEPGLYDDKVYDWDKGIEKDRQQCGFSGPPRECVIIEVPIKQWIRPDNNGQVTRLDQGLARFSLDLETGVVIALQTQEIIRAPRYNSNFFRSYTLTRLKYGDSPDETLFKFSDSGLKEVKALSRWDAPRIKKLLVGKQAPPLEVKDIHGNPISLASFKGKTVLLDFWTTWCPPCRADAPSLEKLYQKYGDRDLVVLGISVHEDHKIVEDYLKKNAHSYPVVLTTENEMPRTYQIGVFPTYIVISPDGTIATAMQGDQGFGELRSVLKKASMDTD